MQRKTETTIQQKRKEAKELYDKHELLLKKTYGQRTLSELKQSADTLKEMIRLHASILTACEAEDRSLEEEDYFEENIAKRDIAGCYYDLAEIISERSHFSKDATIKNNFSIKRLKCLSLSFRYYEKEEKGFQCSLAPELIEVAEKIGDFYMDQKQYVKAVEYYQSAVNDFDNSIHFYENYILNDKGNPVRQVSQKTLSNDIAAHYVEICLSLCWARHLSGDQTLLDSHELELIKKLIALAGDKKNSLTQQVEAYGYVIHTEQKPAEPSQNQPISRKRKNTNVSQFFPPTKEKKEEVSEEQSKVTALPLLSNKDGRR